MNALMLKAALKSAGYRVGISERSDDSMFVITRPDGDTYGAEMFSNEEAAWAHAVDLIAVKAEDITPEEHKRVEFYLTFLSKSVVSPSFDTTPSQHGSPVNPGYASPAARAS